MHGWAAALCAALCWLDVAQAAASGASLWLIVAALVPPPCWLAPCHAGLGVYFASVKQFIVVALLLRQAGAGAASSLQLRVKRQLRPSC